MIQKRRTSKYSLAVRRSNAGLGLFTNDAIKKGRFIIEYYGPIISDEQADEKGGKYLFSLDKHWVVDGSRRTNQARYINHSCKPNCYAEIDGKRIYIYAKRNIEPGEELAYYYGKDFFEDDIKPMGCKCAYCKSK